MGASVGAYWPGITEEQIDGQPGFWNDCKAWGDWMAEREGEPDVIQILQDLGVGSILTFTTEGVDDDDVDWVSPRELYVAANKLQDAVRAKVSGTDRVLEVYARHANEVDPIEDEFIQDLEDVKALALWAESEGAEKMTLEVNW